MELSFTLEGSQYAFDPRVFYDISIPMEFNGPQPSAFGVEPASSAPYRSGSFVGSIIQGGSCNFEKISIVPHCNGTHTECLGHITKSDFSVQDELKEVLLAATLTSVGVSSAEEVTESYRPKMQPGDRVLTRSSLEQALRNADRSFLKALVIRTLPNSMDKCSRDYQVNQAPYFTIEAMEYLLELEVRHLLVDLPSLDRAEDQGKLTNHHLFWGMKEESHDADKGSFYDKTVTELIFVGDEVEDGSYMLNLQIAPFRSDAAPSRPVLFKVRSKM